MLHKLEALLEQWRASPLVFLPLANIETTEHLQPRTLDAVPVRYRPRLDEQSVQHITRMRAKLEHNPDAHMDGLLIADCGGRLLVVDGHHRLSAYRLAKRDTVPARVAKVPLLQAVATSRLVNCDGTKLPLHADQAREAAWQYIAEVTLRGRRALPESDSLRGIASAFGIAKSTAERMKNAVAKVDLAEYSRDSLDPVTGWPRWRFCRGNAWRSMKAEVPLDDWKRARAERLAANVAALFDKEGPEIARLAVEILRAEREDETADLLDRWHDAEDDTDSDY